MEEQNQQQQDPSQDQGQNLGQQPVDQNQADTAQVAQPASNEPQPAHWPSEEQKKALAEGQPKSEPYDPELGAASYARKEKDIQERFAAMEENIQTILDHVKTLLDIHHPDKQAEIAANARVAMETKVPYEPEEGSVAADPTLSPNEKIQAHLAVNNVA